MLVLVGRHPPDSGDNYPQVKDQKLTEKVSRLLISFVIFPVLSLDLLNPFGSS